MDVQIASWAATLHKMATLEGLIVGIRVVKRLGDDGYFERQSGRSN